MKKRVLSLFLAAVLCLSLLPTAGFAEDVDMSGNTTIGGGESSGTGGGIYDPGTTSGGGGVYTPSESSATEANAAAQIGTTYYATLPKALDAAKDGDTVTLLKDHTTVEGNTSTVAIVKNRITLELNGETVDSLMVGDATYDRYNEETGKYENVSFTPGNLTVVSTGGGTMGKIKHLELVKGGLNIQNGQIGYEEGEGFNTSPAGGLTCDKNSGTVAIGGSSRVLGLTVGEGASVTVSGGSAHAGSWCNDGELTITGGEFSEVTFLNNDGSIAISGGTFGSITNNGASGKIPPMSLLAKGYAFYSKYDPYELQDGSKDDLPLYNVTVKEHTHTVVDGKCACGASFVVTVTGSGSTDPVWYTSLDDALDAVKDGDTVTLQGDAEVTKAHWLGTSFTLELNGKTATIQKGAPLNIRARIVIQDSSDAQSGKMVCNDTRTNLLDIQNGDLIIESGSFHGKIVATAGGESKLTIKGGTFTQEISIGTHETVSLSGGTFAQIWHPASFLDLLADGYAFYKDSNVVNAANIDTSLHDASVRAHQHSFSNGACGCGYTCPHTSVNDADGKCTVCEKQFAASVTAGEDVTYYDTLGNALNYAKQNNNCTLKLLADVTETTVMINDPFIFDLNGHNVAQGLSTDAKVTIKDSGTTKGKIGTLSIHNDTDPDADAPTPTIVLGDLMTGGDSLKADGKWLTVAQLLGTTASGVSVVKTDVTGVTAAAPTGTVTYGENGMGFIELDITPNNLTSLTEQWFELKNGAWKQITGAGGTSYSPANLSAGTHTIRGAVMSNKGWVLSNAVTVTVTPASIESASVSLDHITFVYDGTAKKPTVTEVTLGGLTTLTSGKDYYVEVTPQTNVGSYTLTVNSMGNYTGKIENVEWKIEPMKIDHVMFSKDITKTYSGSAEFSLTTAERYNCLKFYGEASSLIDVDPGVYVINGKVRFLAKNAEDELVDSPEAGKKSYMQFTVKLLSENYVLQTPDGTAVSELTCIQSGGANFTIEQASINTSNRWIEVRVFNELAKTYEVELQPNLDNILYEQRIDGEFGKVTYSLDDDGASTYEDYYKLGTAKIENGKLILPIKNGSGVTSGDYIVTLMLRVESTNFKSFDLPIHIVARDKIVPMLAEGSAVSATDITYGQTLSDSELAVTGSMEAPSFDAPNTIQEIPGTFAWKDGTVKPNAGDYEAEWTFTPDEGYKEYAVATGKVTVKVNKADPTFTAPTDNTLTYTGKEQTLLTAGSTQDGTMMYRLGDSGEFVDSIPTGKNAGTYTVYYKVVGDGNHNDTAEQSITVAIKPMELSRFVSTPAVTKTYDGTAVAPLSEGAVTFNSRSALSISLPEGAFEIKNARFTKLQDESYVDSPEVGKGKSLSFIVTLTSDNYVFEARENENPKTIVCDIATDAEDKFTITKATAPTNIQTGTLNVINGTKLEYTYDAKQLLPNAPKGTYGTVFYAGEPSSDFETGYTVDSCKVGINSGVLTLTIDAQNGEKTGKIGSVTIYVTTDNYETISMPIDLYAVNKITPVADGKITATKITYGDALSKSHISGKMKDPATNAEIEGAFSWQNPNTVLNASTLGHDVGWQFTPKDGNTYTEATGTATVKVDRAQQYGKPSMAGYTYGETPSTPSLTERTGDPNAQVTYYYFSADSGTPQTWSINDPPALSAGTYHMLASISQTDNYYGYDTTYCEFVVAKATPAYTKPTGLTAKYGQTLADVTLPDGWSWMDSTESVGDASTTAKTFKAKFTPTDTKNYNTVENIELEVTVNKADQAALTIQGKDSVVYGETLTLTTTGGSGTGAVTYHIDKTISTGEATIDPDTGVLTPVKVGSVSVIATKAGDNDYNDVTSAPFVLMVKPATPTGAPSYTKITTGGKTLADAALTTKDSTLKPNVGKLEWVDEKGNVLPNDTKIEANTTYKWRFTPTDTNYTTLTGEIELYHRSSGGGGGVTAPSITVPVSSEKETVKVDATVSGSTAAVEITEKQLDQVTSDGDTVTVDVSGLKDVDSAKLPSTIIEKAGQTDAELTVVLPTGSVALDTKALAAIDGTKDVTVSVRPATLTDAQRETVGALTTVAAVVDVKVLIGTVEQTGFGGGRLTVAIPYTPKAGEDTARLTVWFLRDDGSIEDMGGRYDAETGCFVFQTDHLSRYLLVDKGFVDVPAGSYYEDAVAWAVANGITTGTDATHFAPDGSCTRAQAVTFLWRAAGSPAPESTTMPYADVPAGSYYHDAVLWAVEQGITKGTSETTFSPNDTCTRAQIVTLLWRAEKAPAAGGSNHFADVKSNAYYADAVLWAVAEGITKGTTDTTFSPNADCTRAQIVTFLWRSMK